MANASVHLTDQFTNSLQVDESIVIIINIIDRHDLFAQVFSLSIFAFEIIVAWKLTNFQWMQNKQIGTISNHFIKIAFLISLLRQKIRFDADGFFSLTSSLFPIHNRMQ